MSRFRSDLLRTLDERGFVHQVSEPERLDALAADRMITAYIGFDATAPSLHVGHMVQIMLLFWTQKTGHRPLALMGGGTTKVGDPSFRNEARPLLTEDAIAANLSGIRRVFDRFLTFGTSGNAAVMLDNSEWLDGLNYLEFLRDVGRHFSVNRMLSFDSVKTRLEKDEPLSFLEFNYMILQAYDFVELYRRYGCRVQMGGSDQWGNIVNGIDLGRRLDQADLFAVTSPLLTTASGAKMGKTASGAVWLDAEMRPVFDFWQYWRNVEDADVGRFLKMFTELPLDEVARLEGLGGQETNEAKKVLATEVTALVHGRAQAEEAAEAARQTFEEGALAANLPMIEIARSEFDAGLGVLTAFVKAELVGSTSDARRQVKAGGLKVNDRPVSDERAVLGGDDLTAEGTIKLSLGRKRHVLIRPG